MRLPKSLEGVEGFDYFIRIVITFAIAVVLLAVYSLGCLFLFWYDHSSTSFWWFTGIVGFFLVIPFLSFFIIKERNDDL